MLSATQKNLVQRRWNLEHKTLWRSAFRLSIIVKEDFDHMVLCRVDTAKIAHLIGKPPNIRILLWKSPGVNIARDVPCRDPLSEPIHTNGTYTFKGLAEGL